MTPQIGEIRNVLSGWCCRAQALAHHQHTQQDGHVRFQDSGDEAAGSGQPPPPAASAQPTALRSESGCVPEQHGKTSPPSQGVDRQQDLQFNAQGWQYSSSQQKDRRQPRGAAAGAPSRAVAVVEEVDLRTLAPLEGPVEEGAVIAYRLLEIGPDFTPQARLPPPLAGFFSCTLPNEVISLCVCDATHKGCSSSPLGYLWLSYYIRMGLCTRAHAHAQDSRSPSV